MKWLIRLVAALAVAAICGLIFTEVIDHTILSSNYLEQKATQVDAYNRLANDIVTQLGKQTSDVTPEQVAAIKTLVTPDLVKQQVNSALRQFELYYKGSSPTPPTIDVTGLVAQARAAGLQIAPNSQFDKPITLTSNPQAKKIGSGFENIKLGYVIASIVLLGLLVFLSWEKHRWAVLPDVGIICGVLLGVAALIFALAPDAANHFAKFNFDSNTFASLARDLATAIVRNISKTFIIIATVLFVIGLVARLLLAKFQPKPKKPTKQASNQQLLKNIQSRK